MPTAVWAALSSRALTPLVIGFFLLLYIVIAFFTEEALTALIAFTGRNFLLAAVFALLPLNCACRLVLELGRYLKRRRVTAGKASRLEPELYDETVELVAAPELAGIEERLGAGGYRTRRNGDLLAAWKGINLAAARILLLAGTCCLFTGILVSLTTKGVYRQPLIEGEPFQPPKGGGARVERIVLSRPDGPILLRDLLMQISDGQGGETRDFGVYPPAMIGGVFVYPRYLGVALDYRLETPDLPGGYPRQNVFPLYPPGKEASDPIPDTPYRITFSLATPEDGSDPYATGHMVILFKLMKGPDVVASGSLVKGGEFVKDGIRLKLPDMRRMVITDFVRDYGVLLIWATGALLLLGSLLWLPVRWFAPRREIVIRASSGSVLACSRAEGRRRRHDGVFHESLDVIAATQPAAVPVSE